MASQDVLTNRSIAILINLSAGLDEAGLESTDERVQLTANTRLAAAAGAAALSQRAKRSSPFSNHSTSAHVQMVKSAANWLDQLKQAKGFHGDVSAAEFLGVSPTQFSRWRTGKDLLDNYHAWQIAGALNVNPMVVIGSVSFHHSRDTERTRWLAMLATVIDSDLPAVPVKAATTSSLSNSVPPAISHEPVPEAEAGAPIESSAQGSKWTDEEDNRLVEAYQDGTSVDILARVHRRTPKAILLRLSNTHRLIGPELLASLSELYGVDMKSPGRDRKTERKKGVPRVKKQEAQKPTVFL